MKERIVTRNFICTFMAQLCLALVLYTMMSTVTEYAAGLGVAASFAGFISGIYVVGGLVSRMFSGSVMKKYGWKHVALVFGVLHFIAGSCYMLAGNAFWLMIIRFIHGIGFGATANAIMLIGMASLPKSRFGEAAGYFMLSTALGIALGPFFGGLIYDFFGGNGCFITASVLSLLIVIFISGAETRSIDPWYETRNNPSPAEKKPFSILSLLEPKAVPVSLCIFFLCFGYAALMSFYRLYAVYLDMAEEFSYFFLIYAGVLVFSRPFAGKLQDIYGDNIICYPCITAQAVGIALLAWKPCLATIVICAVCGALGYGTLNSTLNVIVNRQVDNERRPFAVTTYWAFSDLGVGVAPALLGFVAEASGFHALYFAGAFLSFIALPVYWFFHGRKQTKG